MRRLSDEEFEYQRNVCNYPRIASEGTVENRIIGGSYVKKSPFPMPVVAIMSMTSGYKCAATFITRRHLVTAGHCFSSLFDNLYSKKPSEGKSENGLPPYLLVGGICIRKTKDRCVDTDTERRDIDYVIYASEGGVDLAIIQLRKDQKEWHGTEFLPACIYDTYADYGLKDPPPSKYEIYGWGIAREGDDPGKFNKRLPEARGYV
ncbi:Peptidase S1/S6 [Aphelenchoides avenae]|nr:Peptidase S1/S6 [Aphelenchus avenae]